jgi:chromosome partitioning protein
MTTVLATYNVKGGVGKTSAAVNLARLAAEGGARTLIWDLDPQGASTYLFRVKPKVKGGGKALVKGKSDVDALLKGTDHDGLDLLPADFSYRHLDLALDRLRRPHAGIARVVEPLTGDYDVVILDCPPSISLLSESVFGSVDALLVPIVPSTLSVRTFEQLQDFLDSDGRPSTAVVAFLSMVDRRKRLHRELAESLPTQLPALTTAGIPLASAVELMAARRAPLVSSHPRDRAALAYAALWREIQAQLGA